MIARCDVSDLPVESCACERCAPDAEVVKVDDPTPHAEQRSTGGVPVEVPAPLDLGTRPLSRALQQAADLYDTLGGLLGGHRTGPDNEGGKSANEGPPLPLREQVAEHRHQLVHDLRWWVGRVSELYADTSVILTGDGSERRVVRVPQLDSSVHACAGFLNAAGWLHTHDDGAVLVDVLRAWVRRAHVLSDLPKLRARLPLHACYSDELVDCDGVAYALIPADRDELLVVECDRCRSRWDVAQLPEAGNYLTSPTDAARLVGASERTVRNWSHIGSIESDDAGRVLLGDVLRKLSADNLSRTA